MIQKRTNNKPIIGFSIGDMNGIGPELILKTLNEPMLLDRLIPVVYGSSKILNYYKKIMPHISVGIQDIRDIPSHTGRHINVINCVPDQVNVTPGELTSVAGNYAALSLTAATKALKEKTINALVTAPIHKKNIQAPDFPFIGHTPFLQHYFQAEQVLMLMVSDSMKVALLTEHLALKDVPAHITIASLLRALTLLHKTLRQDFLIDSPRIAVLGLNPHSGDEGLMGKEESDFILPAIKQANSNHILAFGPYSADSFFARGYETHFDAVLAMYHDQGLIPFKALSLGSGVNYTAGLECVRTSPDHGTGFDIAGRDRADISSFRESIFKAIDIYEQKISFQEMGANALKKSKVYDAEKNRQERDLRRQEERNNEGNLTE